ncbi:MAG: hypothetical protein MRZ74_09225 [Blautia sp.]|nr:hypothetical protein [Blautia sp.]MDY5032608.1 hypothetical protein [Blautia sp.]
MDYVKIVEEFSGKYPDYKNDVWNFSVYLEKQWKNSLSDANIRFLLQGLDVKFLLDSLIYNVEERGIYKRKNAAKKYVTVIGIFFDYIRKNTDIDNPGLFEAISYNKLRENTYMKQMMSYINECNQLQGTIELEGIGRSEAEKVLKWADAQLEDDGKWYGDIEKKEVDETAFRKAMVALGLKLMLIYGFTYRELRKIKIDQYNSIRNTITVGGFEIRLPINMGIQMKRMKDFLEKNKIRNKKGFLFTNAQGEEWGETTSASGISDTLSQLIESTSVTSIIKYGISQLLKAGLNDSIIKQITGASDTLIKGCIVHKDEDIERIINNRLVDVELYYQF